MITFPNPLYHAWLRQLQLGAPHRLPFAKTSGKFAGRPAGLSVGCSRPQLPRQPRPDGLCWSSPPGTSLGLSPAAPARHLGTCQEVRAPRCRCPCPQAALCRGATGPCARQPRRCSHRAWGSVPRQPCPQERNTPGAESEMADEVGYLSSFSTCLFFPTCQNRLVYNRYHMPMKK